MSGGFEDDIEEMPDPASAGSSAAGSSAGSTSSTTGSTTGSTSSTTGSTTGPATLPASCVPEDFVSLAPSRCCVYLPCKSLWPNASIDDRFGPVPLLDVNGNPVKNASGKVVMIPFTKSLARERSVEKLVWAPGMPEFIHGKLAVDGGWVEKQGATTLNTFRAPNPKLGDPAQATRWVEHWHKLYPDEAKHIIAWFACRVQHPEVMINHALLLGGAPKIGKDTLLEAVVKTVGEWNFRSIKLNDLVAKNNDHLQTIILRVNEARDVGEQGTVDRYRLYDHIKDTLTSPPSTLRVNIKYVPEFEIMKCLGMVITTNHRDAFFLPPEDRRFFVAFSERHGEEFPAAYWNKFWGWYQAGGFEHVAAYLFTHDVSNFDPKAEPPKTDAFWTMVSMDRGGEHGEIADAIDLLKDKDGQRPDALTLDQLSAVAPALESLRDKTKRTRIRRRLEDSGYVVVVNPKAKRSDGLWFVKGRRQTIYASERLDLKQRLTAAKNLADG
jgi:hypothetical protein